jgi:protein involved in polysaccharide export with SLBB domain
VAIEKHLSVALRAPQVSVSLQQLAGQQQIVGEHLIGRDGTVTLGIYGSIHVAGKTVPEARAAIEQHLSQFLEAPKISVEVYTYASKTYYVIFDGAGQGVQMFSVPATGKETVLDAISVAGGLTPSSSSRIWIARPAPHRSGCEQILPVDWDDVTKYGGTATNFQIFPNDRVYVADDRMIRFANVVGKATQPFERVLGFMLLGSQAIQVSQRFPEGR